MAERPLFIPLKTEYFNQFKSGEKEFELRAYGPRWNEDTCKIGRTVTISKGYGKHERISGVVSEFRRIRACDLSKRNRAAFTSCYGDDVAFVAAIGITLTPPTHGDKNG